MDWELEHKKRIEANAKQVEAIYIKAAQEAAQIGAIATGGAQNAPFSFDQYPATKARIDGLLKNLGTQLQTTITTGSKIEWDHKNGELNALTKEMLGIKNTGTTQLDLFAPPPEAKDNPAMAKLFNNNESAREAFLSRKTGPKGLNLSDRVWKYTNQFKDEIEMALDDGIRSGKSAAALARDTRQFLQEPDRVYRRFQLNLKDAQGNPVLDQFGQKIKIKQERRRYIDADGKETWKVENPKYHPGRGLYKSSLKNSQRLTRTENNMAYRTADHTRSQQLDFVVGFEVMLSGSHPVFDICDHLKGKYPKEYIYKGWHPICFCWKKFILKTPEELAQDTQRILSGLSTTPESQNRIKELPAGYNQWMESNQERLKKAGSLPYFIQDNYQDADFTKAPAFEAIQAARLTEASATVSAEDRRVQDAIKREAEKVRQAEAARASEAVKTDNLFIPANTIQQAIDYAKNNIGITISDKNELNLIALNTINENFTRLTNSYVNDLKVVKSFYELSKNQTIYASTAAKSGLGERRISFNKIYWNNLNKMEKQLGKDVANHFHPIGCSTPKSMIDHEFAHVLTSDAIKAEGGIFNELTDIQSRYYASLKEYTKSGYGKYRSKSPDFISGYCDKTLGEFTSEAFSMALNSNTPSKYAIEVLNLINKHFKK